MQAFEYSNPSTLDEALKLMGQRWGEVEVLAGGTDLLSLVKDYVHTPKRVVNVKNIKELGGISQGKAEVRIGATVTFDDLAENALVRKMFPSLSQAAMGVASPQIRNMGTVGGDLLQRPRCWYFRNGFGLLARDKSGKSLVPDGENQFHAILDNKGPSYFVSPSSLGPALIALGAKVKLASAQGTRTVDVEKFFVKPTSDTMRETAAMPNEILTEILVPTARTSNATYEVRQKQALDWPLAAASVALTMKGTSVGSARIVLGHVAPTPFIAANAAKMLEGKAISEQVAADAAKAALEGATPLSQNAYKVQLARVAVKRALLTAAGGKV
jgi:xanthine dehydrogenase YagS FAD-binding subunit